MGDLASASLPTSPAKSGSEADHHQATHSIRTEELSGSRGLGGNVKLKFSHSKSMPKGSMFLDLSRNFQNHHLDNRFDFFRTWSGKLERQIKPQQPLEPIEISSLPNRETNIEDLTVDRYFDALEGPELETLRPSEEILLPEDKTWPFLLRFPITSFGICLGLSSHAIMWKTLATTDTEKFLHVSQVTNHVLWWISVWLLITVTAIYLLKTVFFFEAVRREFHHPIRINFFFAPFISLLFLALGVPHSIANTSRLHSSIWYILMAPIFSLELKIYGQWMSGGQQRLSKVANPTNHLSVVGNFVGALLGASMGLKEAPTFFFSVGLAHYLVLFVTLYQRLPTNETLPKELHPVFFLFVAAPAVASMAWTEIAGAFGFGSRFAYFISLFLCFSLLVRINFFWGFKFSLAWWAYTFPMTTVATATIKYSGEIGGVPTQFLSVVLSGAAALTVTGVLAMTMVHAFVLHNLFPNDIVIAISVENSQERRLFKQFRSASLGNIGSFFKVLDSNGIKTDIEAPSMR